MGSVKFRPSGLHTSLVEILEKLCVCNEFKLCSLNAGLQYVGQH